MNDSLIKMYRKRAGYSQREVAEQLHVTQGAVSSWESGRWEPDKANLAAMASMFGVSVDALIGRQTPIETVPWKQVEVRPELIAEEETMIPVVASLRCGFNTAGEPVVFKDRKPVPVSWTRKWGTNIVFIDSVGDSMVPTIIPGDTLVCRPGEEWENGNIISVNVDDCDMIKRIYRTADGGIDLRSDNPTFEPLHFTEEDLRQNRVHVLGRVLLSIGKEL